MIQRSRFGDIWAVLCLIALWLLFFWRIFTPVVTDQISLREGDFSGQFFAFAGYQQARFSAGEIPLWNPYNNGGLPFIADTQAAVFYPPRLVTIALSNVSGNGWQYNALQLEMAAHVLIYSLLFYAVLRRLMLGEQESCHGSLIGAVIAAYGGYATGYPPLQLAILEAMTWFPIALLGLHEATRFTYIRWRWLAVAGLGLGLSWLAGHPQTSWMITYVLIAYGVYRAWSQSYPLGQILIALLAFGGFTLGITAVQFLPGLEYLLLTTRSELSFAEKANGFPFQDLLQFFVPNVVSLWSPLYIGLCGLVMVALAIWHRRPNYFFWLLVALFALLYAFGGNSPIYHLAYHILPGARFFRGQERMALIVANSLAILASLGASYFFSHVEPHQQKYYIRPLSGLAFGLIGLAIVIFIIWLGNKENYAHALPYFAFSAFIATLLLGIFASTFNSRAWRNFAFSGLVIFELFAVGLQSPNYEPIPASERVSSSPPAFLDPILKDRENYPFRVDGFRGLTDNYGSLYRVMDIRGISPLFLSGPQRIIYKNYVNNPLAWELFAVRYVFSTESTISAENVVISQFETEQGVIQLRQLTNPRPFALLIYDVEILDSDEFAFALLNDPLFDERQTIILAQEPSLTLPSEPIKSRPAKVISFTPESFIITATTPENAILSVAHVDYPGWRAYLDGEPTPILRAYGALSAIAVPKGDHTITFVFEPPLYQLGAILSLVTWSSFIILMCVWLFEKRTVGRHLGYR